MIDCFKLIKENINKIINLNEIMQINLVNKENLNKQLNSIKYSISCIDNRIEYIKTLITEFDLREKNLLKSTKQYLISTSCYLALFLFLIFIFSVLISNLFVNLSLIGLCTIIILDNTKYYIDDKKFINSILELNIEKLKEEVQKKTEEKENFLSEINKLQLMINKIDIDISFIKNEKDKIRVNLHNLRAIKKEQEDENEKTLIKQI